MLIIKLIIYSYLCIINKFLVELSRLILNYSLRHNTSNLFLLVDEALAYFRMLDMNA